MNFGTYFNSRTPLTLKEFADIFVMDHEQRAYGMISPKGNIYVCPYTEHVTLLYKLPELIQDPNYKEMYVNNVYNTAIRIGWSRFAFYHTTDVLEIDCTDATKIKMASFFLKFEQTLRDTLEISNVKTRIIIDR